MFDIFSPICLISKCLSSPPPLMREIFLRWSLGLYRLWDLEKFQSTPSTLPPVYEYGPLSPVGEAAIYNIHLEEREPLSS